MSSRSDRKPNRLLSETSPYLLQHAYNPVDWYAWGPEALTAALGCKPLQVWVGHYVVAILAGPEDIHGLEPDFAAIGQALQQPVRLVHGGVDRIQGHAQGRLLIALDSALREADGAFRADDLTVAALLENVHLRRQARVPARMRRELMPPDLRQKLLEIHQLLDDDC